MTYTPTCHHRGPGYLPVAAIAAALLLLPGEASAHVGIHAPAGMAGGFMHPFSGLDHILAMLAVGMWAGWLGGSYRWAIPTGFVSAAAVGFMLGVGESTASGMVEQGIAMSLVGLGTLLFFRARLPLVTGLPLVALFGLFHGLAHGSEVEPSAGEWMFMTGFLVSTALIHLGGLVLGGLLPMKRELLRFSGAGLAAVGLFLLVPFFLAI